MRIISGIAKGRKILPPPDGFNTTRPTLDRVKESMFSIIQNHTYGAVVIDVFAGTGSLGLESASRGAKEVYLIDKSSTTFKVLKENIETLKFQNTCSPLNMDSYDALAHFGKKEKKFDIIFIDPPYCKEMIPKSIELVEKYDLLKENGIIVTKIDTKEIIFQGTKTIELYDERKYGNTTIVLYRHKGE